MGVGVTVDVAVSVGVSVDVGVAVGVGLGVGVDVDVSVGVGDNVGVSVGEGAAVGVAALAMGVGDIEADAITPFVWQAESNTAKPITGSKHLKINRRV